MSEELEPVLNLNDVSKGKIGSSSKFKEQEDDMSEEVEPVLNVEDTVAGKAQNRQQSKFKH